MILSVLAFAIMNAIVKYLSTFNVYQIVFFRTIGTLCFTIPIVIKNKIPFFGTHKKLLLLRGLIGVISLTCFFESLHYLAVGTAVSLRYTAPIFAAFFAFIFLKEKIKPVQWLLFILAFIGVLIIKGFGKNVNSIGLVLVLTSAFFMGLIFVVIRKIGLKEHPLVIINYFMIMAFVFGGFMCLGNWNAPNGIEWLLLLSLGVFGYIGQLYMTKAFQVGKTATVAPLKYLEVIFTLLIGVFWFQDIYTIFTLLGILLILLSLFYNIYASKK
ncbi:DMT family transporter [Polaribacter tangerinus]|uniref:DMT family transporter n=1 Tax=Polaribacter tangerinus TaxID=1920034 RepID=UPI000B4BCFAB|nr:DMT family transporter [Polaribacter tangerinus]